MMVFIICAATFKLKPSLVRQYLLRLLLLQLQHSFALTMVHKQPESRSAEQSIWSTCTQMIFYTLFISCLGSRVLTSCPLAYFPDSLRLCVQSHHIGSSIRTHVFCLCNARQCDQSVHKGSNSHWLMGPAWEDLYDHPGPFTWPLQLVPLVLLHP